jgi:hypothetical protein
VVVKKDYPLVPAIRLTAIPPDSRRLTDLSTVTSPKDSRICQLLPSEKSVYIWNGSSFSPNLIPEASAPPPSLADIESDDENDDDELQHR